MENNCYPFSNLPLPYAYDALEPFIDEKTMHLHHDRHLQTYIDNLNAILKEEEQLQKFSLEQLVKYADRLPQNLQAPIRNNAGGVYNHRFFFEGLTGEHGQKPEGRLAGKIRDQYGGVEGFLAEFKKAALSVFGSGYAWLIWRRCGLDIVTTPNQNCPIAQGCFPILTVDVWEHAYYLKHYNVRAAYLDDWEKVINWEMAEQRLMQILANR